MVYIGFSEKEMDERDVALNEKSRIFQDFIRLLIDVLNLLEEKDRRN